MKPGSPGPRKPAQRGRRTVGYVSHDSQRRIDRRVAEILEALARRVPGRKRGHRLTPRPGDTHSAAGPEEPTGDSD
jgi:hypothetical protein